MNRSQPIRALPARRRLVPWNSSPVPPATDRRFETVLFIQATAARILTALVVVVFSGSIGELSRDSAKFHMEAQFIAERYADGIMNWNLWIDHGWRQFIGLLYFLFGPQMFMVLAFNAVTSGVSAVLLYRLAVETFDDEDVARTTTYLFTFFPSVLYYTSLPLREAPAILGLLLIARGTLHITYYRNPRHYFELFAGLMIITALRAYLAVVCGGYFLICLLASRIHGRVLSIVKLGAIGCALVVAGLIFVSFLGINLGDYEALKYFDIEHLNDARMSMNSGNAKLFDSKQDAVLGQDLLQDALSMLKGIGLFFFSVDPTNITRNRQMAAIPELIFFILCVPSLWTGVITSWRKYPRQTLPILLLATLIVLIYSAGTTNGGAMYRWRVQALPFLILIIVFGAHVRRFGLLPAMLVRQRAPRRRRMLQQRRQPA